MTFEEYLKAGYADQYTGTDDDMPDSFEHWLSNKDTEELIVYADLFGEYKEIEGMDRAIGKFKESI